MGIRERGHQPHRCLGQMSAHLCLISESIQSNTLLLVPAARTICRDTNLRLQLGSILTQTPKTLHVHGNSEQVEGLCTATLEEDCNF